jgi:hypothetical protein
MSIGFALSICFALFLGHGDGAWASFAPGIDVMTNTNTDTNVNSDTILILFAGYNITQDAANVWTGFVAQQYNGGFGAVYSVMGPRDAEYRGKEIGTSKLLPVTRGKNVVMAAHSSGSFVAHSYLHQVYGAQKLDLLHYRYANLDGGVGAFSNHTFLSPDIASMLSNRLQATCSCVTSSLCSPNISSMQRLHALYPSSTFRQLNASNSGCLVVWCVHMTLITTLPHNPYGTSPLDYSNIDAQHPVQTKWFDYQK